MKLAEMLVKACQKRSWSMNRLAREAGLSPATLHGWKTGRSAANLDDLKRVAEVLQMPLYQLIFGEPDPYYEGPNTEMLRELFSGDVRVSIHKLNRRY